MDAIKMLKDDHKTVEGLFRRYERAGDKAYETKREVVERIVEELSVHAAIEEQVFYPAVREEVPSTESMTLEALEEHHIVKWTLSELDGMDPRAERYDAKVTVLMESVRHHVEEEEGDLFPKVRDRLSRERLEALGKAMREAKKVAPTRPHPRLPDAPPLNMLTGAVGIADRAAEKVMDTARSAIDFANPLSSSGRDDIGDVIHDVMDDATDTVRDVADEVSARGAKAGRRAQRTVTKASRSASSTAKKATKTAARTASKAASTSKSTAKRASKATAKSAKSTARSAKSTTRSATSTAKAAAKSPARKAKTTAKAASRRAKAPTTTPKRTTQKATKRARATASR